MRRVNERKCSKEGYSWFRFQESKILFFIILTLLLSLALPIIFDIGISRTTYLAHALLTCAVVRYAFTEIFISAEDDGIYLEINRKKHIKLKSWDENSINFLSSASDRKSFLKKQIITACNENGKAKKVYESHCEKMSDFFSSACSDLSYSHKRRQQRKLN